jgi:acyl carrier protein
VVTHAPTETHDRLWSPLLDSLRADALDCVQANLALVADRHAGPGSHLALGATLAFDTEQGTGGVEKVVSSVPHRLTQAEDLLGLRVKDRFDSVDGPQLRELVAHTGPLYVIGDAHTMSWLPYAGQQHLEHTFLLSTPDTVVDAYHDETRWGPTRPGAWRLSPAELDAMVPSATALLISTGPVPVADTIFRLAANATAMTTAVPRIDSYLAAHRESFGDVALLEQLVMDIWLLGRSRLLHAAWLGTVESPDLVAAAEDHAQCWLALAAQSFVALYRARRGGRVSGAVLDELDRLLHEDVAMAVRLSTADTVHAAVVAAIQEVLRVDGVALAAAPTMRELPNYNSFRLVEIIEKVEARLGVELDPDDLNAQTLRDVDSLCQAFAHRHSLGLEVR